VKTSVVLGGGIPVDRRAVRGHGFGIIASSGVTVPENLVENYVSLRAS
jgi:hypothetical protein